MDGDGTFSQNLQGAPSPSMTPLMDEVFSPFHHAALLVFSRLDLFDFIHERTNVTTKELAQHANWSERATSAMLISLVSSGVLQVSPQNLREEGSDELETASTAFSLSPMGQRFLHTGSDGHVNKFLELFWEVSPQLLLEKAAVTDKEENFMLQTGGGEAPSKFFIDAMQGQTSFAARTLTPLMNFESVQKLIDVGGGSGTFVIEACRNHRHLKGSVYELPGVCPITEEYVRNANMTDRVGTISGNMFEDVSFPPADCYAFGNILHDWPDDANRGLLSKAFHSLPPNGTVVVLEMLIAEDLTSTTRSAAGLNLLMVTNEQGRQFKASELKEMMEEVGFVEVSVVSSPLTPYSLVVATKQS